MKMSRRKKALLYAATVILTIWMMGPIVWVVIASFQLDNELFSIPPHWIPENPTLDNYTFILTGNPPPIYQRAAMGHRPSGDVLMIGDGLGNSVLVSGLVALFSLAITVPAAYAFTRQKFFGKSASFAFIMTSRLIPAIALAIPIFVIVKNLGLFSTPWGQRWALILVYLAFTLPFTIWFMSKYFEFMPPDLEDAARVDGCSRLGALIRVVLPVSAPGLAATAAVAFMAAYSEFLFAVFLTSKEARTAPVVLRSVAINHDVSYALSTTALTLSILPPIVFAIIFRRYITRGLSMAFGS